MPPLILVLILVLANRCLSEELLGPLVVTDSGKIRGHYLTSYKGNKYEAYQGIPYAQPPVGELRFQSPVPVEPWTHEMAAIKLKDICLHDFPGELDRSVNGTEDCLYLNVYVPRRKTRKTRLPVLFYIYGGAFRGSGTAAGQESYIIDYDVIFVSVNYRSGSLGFLSTEDDVVPGNMGLKDQALALRWTYDNIESFGGDHQRITLLGGSSGGVSVHLHYLSPWSRGLFHAGISLSGTAYYPVHSRRDAAIALGRVLNCTDDDTRQMVDCLRDVPADVLVGAQNKLHHQVWALVFGPVSEKSSIDAFVDDHPSRILSDGRAYDVPWITGLVGEEGLGLCADWVQGDTLRHVDDKWNALAPLILHYSNAIPKDEHASLARKIRKHYIGEKSIDRETFRNVTHLIGDRLFSYGAVNAAEAQATVNKSPVYFYYHTYRAVDSLSNADSNSTENLGVAHGDDVHLVIKDPRILPAKSPNDMAMQKRLIKIWTSVAYNGVPDIGVEWPRVAPMDTGTAFTYLHLAGPDNLTAESNDNFAENKFWNSLGIDEK